MTKTRLSATPSQSAPWGRVTTSRIFEGRSASEWWARREERLCLTASQFFVVCMLRRFFRNKDIVAEF